MSDNVNHPAHYEQAAIVVEPIHLCEMFDFNHGNALKYIIRYQLKGKPVEDLGKAIWYIRRGEPAEYQQQKLLSDHLASIFLEESSNPVVVKFRELRENSRDVNYWRLLAYAAGSVIEDLKGKPGAVEDLTPDGRFNS